ncbi:unnamed protein product [Amoebophrya sp. A120]|nr:unnamed protein product [Amoebophrya sp. A120]|eukprot:GSA120T00005428001.1
MELVQCSERTSGRNKCGQAVADDGGANFDATGFCKKSHVASTLDLRAPRGPRPCLRIVQQRKIVVKSRGLLRSRRKLWPLARSLLLCTQEGPGRATASRSKFMLVAAALVSIFTALSVLLALLTTVADAIFIDYDCAFGSYTYDWTAIYDMIMKDFLGSGRQSMEIPAFVSQNVVQLLDKGKRECPLGAMQIALMFYYYTLRDYENSILKLVVGVRREILKFSSGTLDLNLAISEIREELRSLQQSEAAKLSSDAASTAAIPDDATSLANTTFLAPQLNLPTEEELDRILKPEFHPKIKISKTVMAESVELVKETTVKFKLPNATTISVVAPHVWREALLNELGREPKEKELYLDALAFMLQYFQSRNGLKWEDFAADVLNFVDATPKRSAAATKSTSESSDAAKSLAGGEHGDVVLKLFYYLAMTLDRFFDVVNAADSQLRPGSLKDKLKILMLVLQELGNVDELSTLDFARRERLLSDVFVYSRADHKDLAKTDTGIPLKHEMRGNTTRPQRGSNYHVRTQLQDPQLGFIDSEYEWLVNEEILANQGSLDPQEMEWVEVDTSSHIKAPPLVFRRLYPNVDPNFDHEAGLANEAKKAEKLPDLSYTHLSSALRWFSNDFLKQMSVAHPLIQQCITEISYYSDLIQVMLQQYSVTILAESRWPIFEGLTLHQWNHGVSKEYLCTEMGDKKGLLPWNEVRVRLGEWSQVKSLKIQYPGNEEIDEINLELERYTAEVVQATLGSKAMHAQSEVECPLALMLVACIEISSAANRYSEYVPNFEAPVNMMFETLNWQRISAAGWPIWQTLVYYSDINKGEFLFSPDKKYSRKFLDLDLRDNELNLYDYENHQFGDLQALRTAPSLGAWGGHVRSILLRKLAEPEFQLRPIFVKVLNAIAVALGFERLLETDSDTADAGEVYCGNFFEEHYLKALEARDRMRAAGPNGAHVASSLDAKIAGYDKLITENILARDHIKLPGVKKVDGSVAVTDDRSLEQLVEPEVKNHPLPVIFREEAILVDKGPLLNYLFQQEFGLECGGSGVSMSDCVQERGCCIARADPRAAAAKSRSAEEAAQSGDELSDRQKKLKEFQPNQSKKNWSQEEARFIEQNREGDFSGTTLSKQHLPQPVCLHHPQTRLVFPMSQGRPQYSPLGAVYEKELSDGRAGVDSENNRAVTRSARRLVLVTLLYGKNWSEVLPIMLGRLYGQLQITYPMVVVSVGETAYTTCLKYQTYGRVGCWQPKTESQVHRFTIIFFLMQLGLEILYFDMDTYAVQDFITPIVEYADRGNHDILFPQHPDGPCINIGLFYFRPTILTLQWFHDFLEWYHSYPYEVDQRGLDALTYANSTLKVSHQPRRVDMSVASPYWVDSLRTYVMMAPRGPWMGDHYNVKFIHWFSRTFDDKWPEIQIAYNAGDRAANEGMSLSQAMRLLKNHPELAEKNENFRDIKMLMDVMDIYKVDKVPEKPKCW